MFLRVYSDQLQTFLHECERRAAVVIQRTWRGFKERRRYTSHRNTLRQKQQKQQAAVTLQRAVHTHTHTHTHTLLILTPGGERLDHINRRRQDYTQIKSFLADLLAFVSSRRCVSSSRNAEL